MFSFHKPKIYRSLTGCCICRAKSSSSRFTDSGKYEPHFRACFHLKEERSGDICNACVLLVKRFKKLPPGFQRHWGHVVDARANTKVKTKASKPEKIVHIEEEEDNATDDEDDDIKVVAKKVRKKREKRINEGRWNRSHSKAAAKLESQMPSFLDPKLWQRETICCGTIFRGPMNAIVIDTNHFRPCLARRASHHQEIPSSPDAESCSASSSSPIHFKVDAGSSSVSSSSPIHFKVDGSSSKGSSDGEATSFPTDFNRVNNSFTESQNGHSKVPVLAAL